jgi:hypothetical protein
MIRLDGFRGGWASLAQRGRALGEVREVDGIENPSDIRRKLSEVALTTRH